MRTTFPLPVGDAIVYFFPTNDLARREVSHKNRLSSKNSRAAVCFSGKKELDLVRKVVSAVKVTVARFDELLGRTLLQK